MQIYRDKIDCDNQDDGAGTNRQPFATFMYEWYLNKYGLRRLAEQQICKMLTTLIKHRKSSLACCKFGQFLGMFDALPSDCFNVYLDFFSVILGMTHGQSFESAGADKGRGQEDPEAQVRRDVSWCLYEHGVRESERECVDTSLSLRTLHHTFHVLPHPTHPAAYLRHRCCQRCHILVW